MAQIPALLNILTANDYPQALIDLYGKKDDVLQQQKERYCRLVKRFQNSFPEDHDVEMFSSPGRTEVGGNHTDHNAGRVLAAAVNLDVLAAASKTSDRWIIIESEGYRPVKVDTGSLAVVEQEKYSPAALVRGICARMKELGYTIGGFHACFTSSVPNGSGLSSSAAFEMMVAKILNVLYNQDRISPVQSAQIGQFAENIYFGKPSGLMDQTTSAVGGFVTIDFKDFNNPVVRKVQNNLTESGYSLVIIGTGGSHADLNEDYAAIANEMKSVAQFFGGKLLREFSAEQVLENIPNLRGKVSDRAILRALHFYADNDRVVQQVEALESGNIQRFLELVNESGRSSWMMLQNTYSTRNVSDQGIALAQAVSETILKGKGAWRVHGGGFAGTIQAFVPDALLPEYMRKMSTTFGAENVHPISIRSQGATKVSIQ